MRQVKWYVKFPADMYAIDFYLPFGGTEKDARHWAREFFGYDRLPNYTQFWKA